jgi:hypothetical protein
LGVSKRLQDLTKEGLCARIKGRPTVEEYIAGFFERFGNPNYCWCVRWRLKSAESPTHSKYTSSPAANRNPFPTLTSFNPSLPTATIPPC